MSRVNVDIPHRIRSAAADLMQTFGPSGASKRLGISCPTLDRIVDGRQMCPSTIRKIERAIDSGLQASGRRYGESTDMDAKVAARDKRYNLAPGEYDAMLEAQGRACAICRSTSPGAQRSFFCVDHCHATELRDGMDRSRRGLLCLNCNTAIGMLSDSPDLADAAAAYLRMHRGSK